MRSFCNAKRKYSCLQADSVRLLDDLKQATTALKMCCVKITQENLDKCFMPGVRVDWRNGPREKTLKEFAKAKRTHSIITKQYIECLADIEKLEGMVTIPKLGKEVFNN